MSKIIIIGICLGLVSLFIRIIFHIDLKTFMHYYWIVAIAIICSSELAYVCYNLFYVYKIKRLGKLLNEGKTYEFIEGIKELLKRAVGQTLRTMLKLNLTAGYIEAEQFDEAINVLENLPMNTVKSPELNVVSKINLCISYFEMKQYDKSIAIYNENQMLFQKFRNDKKYGSYIEILDTIAAAINGQYENAYELIDIANKKYDDPRIKRFFMRIADSLNKNTQND